MHQEGIAKAAVTVYPLIRERRSLGNVPVQNQTQFGFDTPAQSGRPLRLRTPPLSHDTKQRRPDHLAHQAQTSRDQLPFRGR